MHTARYVRQGFLVLLLAAGVFVGSPAANAANLVVNTLNDDITAGDSLCTLREAITAANNDANFQDCSGAGASAPTPSPSA